MTKFISKLFILCAFVFALAGCSDGANGNSQSNQAKSQTESTQSTQKTSSSNSTTQGSNGPVSASEYFADMKGDFVIEFLWLGCSHCQEVEPFVVNAKNDHPRVEIVKIPTIFNDRWRMDAKVFYAGTELGLTSTELLGYYEKVRVGTNELPTMDDVALFVESEGYSKEEFESLLESEEVANKIAQAEVLTKEFNIKGTPTFVVNGEEEVTSEGVSSYEGLVEKAFSKF